MTTKFPEPTATSATASTAQTMVAIELYYRHSTSDKTYTIVLAADGTVWRGWGSADDTSRGDFTGRNKTERFSASGTAASHARKLLSEKLGKGYRLHRDAAVILHSTPLGAAKELLDNVADFHLDSPADTLNDWDVMVDGAFGVAMATPTPTAAAPAPAPATASDPFVDDEDTDLTPLAATAAAPASAAARSVEVSYLRPSGQTYYPWPVNGFVQDVAMLRSCRDHGLNALLESRAGSGKTSASEAAFYVDGEARFEHYVGSANTEESHLIGRMVQNAEGVFVWRDGPLTRAVRRKVPFLYDEINLVDPNVNALLHPLMDGSNRLVLEEGTSEELTWETGSGFCVIASYNPDTIGGVIDDPLMSRFAVRVAFTTDWSIAERLGVSRKFCDFGRAANALVSSGTSSLSWAPQMRDALDFVSLSAAFGDSFAWASALSKAPLDEQNEIAVLMREKAGVTNVRRLQTDES